MIIVKNSCGRTSTLVGKQEIVAETFYRQLIYTDVAEIDGKLIACNYLTRSIVELSDEEKDLLLSGTSDTLSARELIENWFLVPEAFDDYKLCSETRELLRIFSPRTKAKKYTVMTTLDCNARCFYCYQMGRNKNRVPMSHETANKVADYIIKNSEGTAVNFQWYGGEPLYNIDAIDTICDSLKQAGIEYSSKMISNAYLLSGDILEKAVKDWKLEFISVPIDGSEDVYNKVKAYIYKDAGSAFEIVMGNIKNALDRGIFIVVRVNLDQHNKEDIFGLADELHARFGTYKNFAIYSDILYEHAGPKNPVRESAERMQLVNDMIEFENHCMKLGLYVAGRFNNTMAIHRCMADSDNANVIAPDGRIGKCDHHMETKIYASVFSESTDADMLKSFKKELNTKEMCEKCPMLPECIRLVNCPDDGDPICDDAYKKKKRHRALVSLKNEYRKAMAEREKLKD